MTWLCRVLGHAWSGSTWEDVAGVECRYRECRRCPVFELEIPRDTSPPDGPPGDWS